MKKVAIYCRAREGAADALVPQEADVRRALDEAGVDHANAIVIPDVGHGANPALPGLAALTAMVAAGEVAVLAIAELSRLGRGPAAPALARVVIAAGGRLITAKAGELTPKSLALLSVAFKYNTVVGLQRDRRRRQRTARRLPYGYGVTVLLDGKQADVVRRIFDRYVAAGRPVGAIARELNASGVPAPGVGVSPRWRSAVVRRVLSDPRYAGRNWGDINPSKAVDAVTERDGGRAECRIVDEEMWRRAQERLAAARRIPEGPGEGPSGR